MTIYVPGKVTLRQTWQPMDPDAAAYITAVETADGQALEEKVKIAIDNFVLGCKADGIWSAIKASCILAGARTLAGALVPLVGTAPTNNGPFIADDYSRQTGLKGNGSTKYLNSNYALVDALRNNRHVCVWVDTRHTAGNHAYFGSHYALDIVRPRTQLVAASGAEDYLISRVADETSRYSATINNVAGLQGVSRSSSSSYTRRAASTNQTVAVASLAGDDSDMFIFGRNTTGPQLLPSDARLAFYSIGEALDLAKLDARVTDLINAIGVAIP